MKSTQTCNLPVYGDTFLAISPCALISKCSRYEKIDCRLLPLSRRLLYSMDLYGNYMAKKSIVSCPVPLKVQICNFQVWLLKTIHMFLFHKTSTYMFLFTIFGLRKATTTGSSQPQIYPRYPRCSHVFWRMESYHNHHPHKGLVAWLEPWKWALGKGLICIFFDE